MAAQSRRGAVIHVTDDRGVSLTFTAPPRRVVSLVPSTTETLFALGAGDAVVGVTRFCVHPAERLEGLTRVGGTKDLLLDRLLALQPDLVIGNAEENTREIFAELEPHVPLLVAFPKGVDEALGDLQRLGVVMGREAEAEALLETIHAERAALRDEAARGPGFRYTYLIWREPWMGVNDDTFISALLAEAGGVNALTGVSPRYPTVPPEALADGGVVLLSSEPFPFKERHRDELCAVGVAPERIFFVDGELCSWHGARLAEALPMLRAMAPVWAARCPAR